MVTSLGDIEYSASNAATSRGKTPPWSRQHGVGLSRIVRHLPSLVGHLPDS
jgi:hypothetical protein